MNEHDMKLIEIKQAINRHEILAPETDILTNATQQVILSS